MDAVTNGDAEKAVPISEGVSIGIDIGQRHDPTAIVITEMQRRDYTVETVNGVERHEGGAIHYLARHVERLPLGTPYPQVVERLAAIYEGLKARDVDPYCYVDATGVGQPVVDMLHQAGLSITPVYLTGGERVTYEYGDMRLPKTLLVSRLQVLLQFRLVHLPQTPEALALIQELQDFEIKVNDKAHVETGAFKVGAHDDLVVALGLACWAQGIPDIAILEW
jgi:hypothetical protein